MRLCRFATPSGTPALGVVDEGEIVDLSGTHVPLEPVTALATNGREALEERLTGAPRLPLAEARLLAPVVPRKYLAIALNYAEHVAELGMEAPEVPVFFNKQ